jgi:uncharacterized protein DUF5666
MNRFYPLLLLCSVLLLALPSVAQQPVPATKSTGRDPSVNDTQVPGNDKAPGAQSVPLGNSADDNGVDPLLDAPPLPKNSVTLVGGTVKTMDNVRNRIAVEPFGSGKTMKMRFDERTHFYRDGRETTQLAVKPGERVYVDTQLDADRNIFARNVRVETNATPADASGQVISYDPTRGTLTIQDELSSRPVTFSIDRNTQLKRQDGAASTRDLVPGTLLSVRFAPARGNRGAAQEISIVAVPGSVFTFSGKVLHLDTSIGLVTVENSTDNKRYDIFFAPNTPGFTTALTEGSDVTVQAVFEGHRYSAKSISVNQARAE